MATAPDDHDVWNVACPLCKARPSNPCVYIRDSPELVNYFGEVKRPPIKAGEPTQRPHNERYNRAWQRNQRRKIEEYYNRVTKDPHEEARRAYADAVVKEQHELTTWLRRYGRILWT